MQLLCSSSDAITNASFQLLRCSDDGKSSLIPASLGEWSRPRVSCVFLASWHKPASHSQKQTLGEKSSRNSRWRGENYDDNYLIVLQQPWCWTICPYSTWQPSMKSIMPKRIPLDVFFITIKDTLSDPMKWISYLKMIKDWPATHSRICPYITPTSGTMTLKWLRLGRQSRKTSGKTEDFLENQPTTLQSNHRPTKQQIRNILKWSRIQPWVFWIEFNRNGQTLYWFCLYASSFFDWFPHFSQVKSFSFFMLISLCLLKTIKQRTKSIYLVAALL